MWDGVSNRCVSTFNNAHSGQMVSHDNAELLTLHNYYAREKVHVRIIKVYTEGL